MFGSYKHIHILIVEAPICALGGMMLARSAFVCGTTTIYAIVCTLHCLCTRSFAKCRDTGKFANGTAVVNQLGSFLGSAYPELVDGIFNTPTGTDAQGDPAGATLATLITLFVNSPSYLVTCAPRMA